MTNIPAITPAYASQPTGTPWPTTEWPEGSASNIDELNDIIDAAINDSGLGDTRTVLVIKHGRIIAERYHGEIPFFDRPAEPVGVSTTQISWSMAKSMLAHLVGTLVDEGKLNPAAPAPVPEWSDPNDPRHAITLADLLAMRDGRVPPTIYYEFPDPDCDLDYVPNVARDVAAKYSLSNSFGFGGHNVSLVFKANEG